MKHRNAARERVYLVYGCAAVCLALGGASLASLAGAPTNADATGLAAVLVATPAGAADASLSVETQLQRAIDEYTAAMETRDRHVRLEKFARAEQLFRQAALGDGAGVPVGNAGLYVNLGNAALQAERLGPAIAAYRRALALDPQHMQARQNLDYARSLLPDWAQVESTSRLIDSLFFWRAMVPRGRLLILGAGCFFLAALLFAAGYASRRPLLRNSALIPGLAWAVIGASLLLGHDPEAARNAVLVTETLVYTADSENAAPRLSKPLPGGAEVALRQRRAQWSEILLPDGRTTGWVLSSALEVVGGG